MNRVLIIGHGYVGSAVASVFKPSEKIIIDPRINNLQIKDLRDQKFDVVFVCVDTPKDENFKTLDLVLNEVNRHLQNNIVCCKSTATPQFYKKALSKYSNIKIVYNPEFLSHYSNIFDYQNQTFLIFGGNKGAAKKIATILVSRLKKITHIKYSDIETAALVKYAENSFLAYKVTFFNELYRIHKKLKLSSTYSQLVELLTLDKRIGSSHTQVPGRDGKFGWGGHCYNKDNYTFAKFSKSKLLHFLLEINKKHRKSK